MPNADAPLRRLSPQQAELARLIGQYGSYPSIACAMSLSEHTVKAYVRSLALLFDDLLDLRIPPKQRIFLWVKRLEWELGHALTAEEIRSASAVQPENVRRTG